MSKIQSERGKAGGATLWWRLFGSRGPYFFISVFLVLVLYVSLRWWAAINTVVLEDHDSVALLIWAQEFMSGSLERIMGLDPDAGLFFPGLTALFSLAGWSVEASARLASFASSLVLFTVVLWLGLMLGRTAGVLYGLVLLSFSPWLIRHSYAVLTEPSYVALVYLGLALLWWSFKRPSGWVAGLCGLIFGLAFLNRMEGILFLGFVPLAIMAYQVAERPVVWGWPRVVRWCAVFGFVFGLLAAAQLGRVSRVLDTWAINGRQVWSILLKSPAVSGTKQERIYGLQFDPGQVNLAYMRQNPEEWQKLAFGSEPTTALRTYAILFASNVQELYASRLGQLIGPFVLVFFGLGLLRLYQDGRRFDAALILCFLAVGCAAPLLHNVVIRHILVLAPMMFLVAGFGVEWCSRLLTEPHARQAVWARAVACLCLGLSILAWAMPLRATFKPPRSLPGEYSMEELSNPVRVVAAFAGEESGRQPRVMARKIHLAYHASATHVSLPFTDFSGLVTYSRLNAVDFLYLRLGDREPPVFAESLDTEAWANAFRLVYEGLDAQGQTVKLYRFLYPE